MSSLYSGSTFAYYVFRWLILAQLGCLIVKALYKRVKKWSKRQRLLCLDTYQDLKLQIFIFVLQFTSLVMTAESMLKSAVGPSNLLDPGTVNKFFFLRGQSIYWSDSLFLDLLTFVAILFYCLTIMRFMTSLQKVFTALE